jgi:CO/xanthine dehydrogenase FAD-binding subunit
MYLRPTDIGEALAALRARPLEVLAGGTDFYPARVDMLLHQDVLDVSGLQALRGFGADGEYITIGALTTWSQVATANLPPLFDGLKQAAGEIGGKQIQNAATLAGNVCNASPAADGIPALMALDAELELRSAAGARRVALADFVIGNRRTARRADELLTRILIPNRSAHTRSTFVKLGARRYLVISIVMVAVTLELHSDRTIARAAVAVGACSEVAQRLPGLEAKLVGMPARVDVGDAVVASDLGTLTPISDVRGSAQYRLDAAATLIRRGLQDLCSE